jgi:Xaa-Pro aminopeptidase
MEVLAERELDALLVTSAPNLRYLTGFTGSNGLALIWAAHERREPLFLTDFRYEAQSAQEVGAPWLRQIATVDLLASLAELLAETHDASVPTAQGRLGFEDNHVTVSQHERLTEVLGDTFGLVAAGGIVEELREIKDAGEVELIQAATELADAAMRGLLEAGLSGRTERELAIDLELRMRRLGAEAASFPTIVAAGAHGALPHAQPRAVEVPRGALVTIDWGAVLDGYCSDCTRTYATADPTARQREIYGLVLEAQERSLRAVRAGPSGVEIDAVARTVIEDAGHGEHFGHGLGHGVGIEVHEGPRLSRLRSEAPLRAGNVVTIEPGVYVPGELGVRIEDLAVVTDTGTRVLTSLPKQLTVID